MKFYIQRWLRDERGNASFYLLWFVIMAGIVLMLCVNIIDAFGKQEQSSLSAEQASFAATSVVLDAVAKGVEEYDDWQEEQADEDEEVDYVADDISEARQRMINRGKTGAEATIAAYNSVLNNMVGSEAKLREEINRAIRSKDSTIKSEAARVIRENGGLIDPSEITLFKDGRVAVKSYTRYQARAYSRYIPGMDREVAKTGYGPRLSFIERLGYGESTSSLRSSVMLP